jgi:large subunit ribosomal protein L1
VKDREMKRSKSYREAAEKIDRERLYSPLEAAGLAKETTKTKLNSTVEVAIRLGVDPRKADQMVRGTVNLPHGTGKTARVIVFATGDKAAEAEAAGADAVGSDDLIERIQGGWLDFDAAIATPDQMAKVGRIARILGRQDQLPRRQAGQPAPGDRQGLVRHRQAGGELRGRAGRGAAGQAVGRQGPVPEEDHLLHHHGPRHPGRPEPHAQPDDRRGPGLT